MLKTLPKREFDKLFEILPRYVAHMCNCRDSLLACFFGMHKVVWRDASQACKGVLGERVRYIVIMDNLFKDFEVGTRFDLKGSISNRTRLKGEAVFDAPERDLGISLKDNDYRKFVKQLSFGESLRQTNLSVIDILAADSSFLQSVSIIDYSLLLGEIITEGPDAVKAYVGEDQELARGVYISKD